MRTVLFFPDGHVEHAVVIDGTLRVVERDLESFDQARFKYCRRFLDVIVRSDEPGTVADMLGLPRSEPGIEPL